MSGARIAVPVAPVGTGRYILVDVATGEELDICGAELEALLGIEIGYINWCIESDGVFKQGDWEIKNP